MILKFCCSKHSLRTSKCKTEWWKYTNENTCTCALTNWGELQKIIIPGLRTTWQFSVKNDGRVNKFYLQYGENRYYKVTRGGSRFERAVQISTILFALCHSVAGRITPCKILKFFICSIFRSTWILTAAILLVDLLLSWQLPIWVSFWGHIQGNT